MKKSNISKNLLDEEEKILLASFEKDEWHTAKKVQIEKLKALKAASNYMNYSAASDRVSKQF